MPPATSTLTETQRRYLRLVADGLTSKQIAQAVGGSHHTINVQIGIAMRILGATSRQQAAAMLDRDAASAPAPAPASYEPSYDAPALVDPRPAGDTPSHDIPNGDQRWAIPVTTTAQPVNIMGARQRIGWVLAIAASVALLLAGLVSGVTSLITSLGRFI